MEHGRRWAAGAVALLQVVVIGSIVLLGTSATPHGAPVAVVAPPVIVDAVVDQSDRVEPGALQTRSIASATEARAAVADGSIVAAVVVDLRVEQDTVLLASANGADLNRAVLRVFETVESSYGREVVVQDVVPTRAGDADARGVYLIVGLCVLLGLVGPIVITWLRGPVAPSLARGLVRLSIVTAASAATGLVVAVVANGRYDGGVGGWWVIAALTLLTSATVTLALESLFGVLGIGVAVAVLVLSATPMARFDSASMLAEPWATITPWLPHGAAVDAARGLAYFDGAGARPLAILAGWAVMAVLTSAVSRRERARDAAAIEEDSSAMSSRTGPVRL